MAHTYKTAVGAINKAINNACLLNRKMTIVLRVDNQYWTKLGAEIDRKGYSYHGLSTGGTVDDELMSVEIDIED